MIPLVTPEDEGLLTYTWFLLNISAMCSFSQSTSFRAEKLNSSASAFTNCRAAVRSSAIHDVDPTCSRGFARIAAMISNQNNARQIPVNGTMSMKSSSS
jgi:hypothetical protein